MIDDIDVYPLVLSKRLIRILKKIDDKVSKILLDYYRSKVKFRETYIDITEKEGYVTFISSDKVNKLDLFDEIKHEPWFSPQRIEIKIGRLIHRLIGDKVNPQEIEEFVNDYKALVNLRRLYRNFKIVDGDNMKKWYLQENYPTGGGNLSKSCMRYKFSQAFLSLYTENPDKIKLLILLDESKEKILGRALLWFLDVPKGKIFMDRVYFANDFVLNMFMNKAIKNRWFYKLENMSYNVTNVIVNNKIKRVDMAVKVKKLDYEFFPFVDNIGFYDPKTATLTNNPKYLQKMGATEYYDLCDVTGGYTERNDFDF